MRDSGIDRIALELEPLTPQDRWNWLVNYLGWQAAQALRRDRFFANKYRYRIQLPLFMIVQRRGEIVRVFHLKQQ